MQIPLAFADPVVIEEVSLSQWRVLFDALGWPESLDANNQSLTHDEILSSFQHDILGDELLQAIETIHDLGTTAGRETINSILTDRHIPPGTLPLGLGEREFALHFFLSQRANVALSEAFSRAQVQIQEGSHRRYNDFIGKKASRIRGLASKRVALELSILDHCKQDDLGDHVQLRAFEDEGVCNFQIMRSHHTKAPLAVLEGSASRAKIQYRPVHADFVRYEPSLGRLRITARAASIVQFYRRIFGHILFEDETFFEGDPVCSLKVIQDLGRKALDNAAVFGVSRIWMTECIWERGDRERLNLVNANDCFDSIEHLNLPLNEGQILQAKFKVQIIDKSSRPVTVTVRAPSRIEISQVRHETLINEVLDTVGIRNMHATSQDHNLLSLYPWRHTISTWRDCLGTDTDLLVEKGILTTTRLESVEPTMHPGAGRALQAKQLSPVEYFGVSLMPDIPSQSLSATDLDGLELDIPAFQNHLRKVLEITSNNKPWQPDSWYLDLGTLNIDGHEFRVTYALRQPPHDASAAIRELSSSITHVLLLPTGMKTSTGINEVLLDNALPDRQRVIRDIIADFNLEGDVSALLTAPPRSRLIVDNNTGIIWYDGIEISELRPDTQAFRFVSILVDNFPDAVNSHDISSQLSASRTDGDQTARSAKMQAKKFIKSAIEKNNLAFEDPFKSENGFYRLTVPSWCT